MFKKFAAIIILLALSGAGFATSNEGGKHHHEGGKQKPTNVTQPAKPASTSASSSAAASAGAIGIGVGIGMGGQGGNGGTGGSGGLGGQGGTGGSAAGGTATATGGQVIVSNAGNGSGLTGRIVPDVSASSPITSTSCRNGITAGGSGNGWGGLLGFFSEDDLCEWRLLEANYRATGDHDKANAIRSGMTAQRCEKLNPRDREMFGELCPKPPAQDGQNVAFNSAG